MDRDAIGFDVRDRPVADPVAFAHARGCGFAGAPSLIPG